MSLIKKPLISFVLIVGFILLINHQRAMDEVEDSATFMRKMNERSDRLDKELQPLIERNKKANIIN